MASFASIKLVNAAKLDRHSIYEHTKPLIPFFDLLQMILLNDLDLVWFFLEFNYGIFFR